MAKTSGTPAGLSTGDGIAIFAILIFTITWMAGALYVLSTGDQQSGKVLSDQTEVAKDMDDDTAFALLLMIFGPPIFCLFLAYRIVVKD